MKNLSYIPIALFVLVNTVYDFFHIPKSTGWSVFYFAGTYISLLLWTILEAYKGNIYEKIYFISISTGVLARIIIELSKIRMPYELYMDSINNKEKSLMFAFLTLSALALFIYKMKNGKH